jgi:uncharacterized protein
VSPAFFLFLAALGCVAGFGAGFIGLGGGVLLFPLLLYLPPLLGLESPTVKTVAAIVISQVFFAGAIGGIAHWRKGRVHNKLTLIGAVASAAGAFIGGVASKWVSDWFLLLLFGLITLFAGGLMFLPGPAGEQEEAPTEKLVVPTTRLALVSSVIGIVVGLLGAGNFLFVPLLIYGLKVPTRITIGSSLVIHVLNTFSGFLGKLITGQIPFALTIAVVVGTSLGALAGERTHSSASPRVLRYVYAGVIGAVALRVWITILLHLHSG